MSADVDVWLHIELYLLKWRIEILRLVRLRTVREESWTKMLHQLQGLISFLCNFRLEV